MTSPESTTDVPELSRLVRLTHHRWVIPLVAAIGPGARFAVLESTLGVARQTLRRALDAADRLGLILRNPGYGHPLRPEYLLSPDGEEVSAACVEVVRQARALDGLELVGRKWILPILAGLAHGGATTFAELQALATPITPAALTRTLDDLLEAGWIERETYAVRPGRAPYRLARRTRPLARAARELTR